MVKQVPVSVIIPCYNVEKYIGEALQSLVSQDVSPQEVVIVNDASEDETLEAIQPFVGVLNIIVASIEKGGQGVARNHGISLSSAPYIYFLDADDKVQPGMLSRVFCILEKYSWPDLLFFSGRAIQDEDYSGRFKRKYKRKKVFPALSGEEAISVVGKDRVFSASPCMYISRRSLWGMGGVNFKKIIHEDEEVLYSLILSSGTVVSVDEELFLRRLRLGSTMTSPKGREHVYGRKVNMISSLGMLRAKRWNLSVKWALRKRAFWMSMSYFKVCHQAGVGLSFINGLHLVRNSKSPEVLVAFALFYIIEKLNLLKNES
ncbi:glycosyltransferase family 2 protein [Halomonas mongoliensis]|uniref:glycosyltransferase family 2 protein n=1 Tax=Halomonas mongoliensis TaxID=321265 RepID=UPI00403B181E